MLLGDVQADIPSSQDQNIEVVADLYWPPANKPESSVTLELPILDDRGIHTITLPVSFDNGNLSVLNEMPNLNNISWMEIKSQDIGMPGQELEVIFLPEKSNSLEGRKKCIASNSTILASPEIIQAKKEKELLKKQKARAVEERKVRTQKESCIMKRKSWKSWQNKSLRNKL